MAETKREIVGDLCHDIIIENIKPKLSYSGKRNFDKWRKQLKDKLVELTGMDKVMQNAAENPEFMIEEDVVKDGYRRIRFTFFSEIGSLVPCYLLVPLTGKKTYPLAITLQGHSTGFHNSIGEAKSEDDLSYITTRGDFAVQAVKEGYCALCVEQRCMGERVTSRHTFEKHMCSYPSLAAILLGRTVIAERCFDISRAIDMMSNFDFVDKDKILITGNSGGGTTSFYAACFDERIKISAPSCAFCSYEKSILLKRHCACNYIPSAFNWFEMYDLAALIAPRDLIIIAGKEDPIFNIKGVKKGFSVAKKIYSKIDAENNVKLFVTPKAHYWCKDIVWNSINTRAEELGWLK